MNQPVPAKLVTLLMLSLAFSRCNGPGTFSRNYKPKSDSVTNANQSAEGQNTDSLEKPSDKKTDDKTADSPNAPKPNFRVVFIGDQGLSDNTRAVLQSIKAAQANLMVIMGDFDYEDDPDAWDQLTNDVLGDSFPIIAAIGNHDTDAWVGYMTKLTARLAKMKDIKCDGDYGVNMTCTVKGITFVLSGVGTMGSDHEAYMDQALKKATTPWKVCAWHKNQTAMQAGDKSDEVGWLAYETCRNAGAIVATAHEHSYARTHLLSNFEMQTIASKDSNLVLEPGKSFAFVSGLGGNSVRDQAQTGDWFAKIYTSNQAGTYGALFCDFNVDNDPRKAKCQFKNINNEVIDSFTLTSKLPL